MQMRRAKDVETFLQHPSGRYVSGPRWLVFDAGTTAGMQVWDSPSAEDATQVVRTLSANLEGPPRGYFIDARRLAPQPDPAAFSTVLEQAGPRLGEYRDHIRGCAVVLPAGMAAAVVRGFFELAPPPFDVRFFADPVPALEYLGEPGAQRLLASLDELQEECSGTAPLLFRLRAALDHDPAEATIERAARELSLSRRSLQRRLEAARTTFRAELLAARLRMAQRLLTATDLKVTAIALEVGCASSQHLSALFRRMTGETPSAWRGTHRLAS